MIEALHCGTCGHQSFSHELVDVYMHISDNYRTRWRCISCASYWETDLDREYLDELERIRSIDE